MMQLQIFFFCNFFLFCYTEEHAQYGNSSENINPTVNRVTLFWNKNRDKVTQYINGLDGRVSINLDQSEPFELPRDILDHFRHWSMLSRRLLKKQRKIIEVTNVNFVNVVNDRPAEERRLVLSYFFVFQRVMIAPRNKFQHSLQWISFISIHSASTSQLCWFKSIGPAGFTQITFPRAVTKSSDKWGPLNLMVINVF